LSKPAYDAPTVELGTIAFDSAESGGAPAHSAAARPANTTRSLFHVASGALSLALIRLLPGRTWLIAVSLTIAIAAWTMEAVRRRSPEANDRLMRLFGPIAHPQERYRVNSSTWYVTALLILATFFPLRAAELGVVVLGLADPAAGLIGRRFGRTRLRAGRSLEGMLAFVVVGTLSALAALIAFHELPWSSRITLALVAAVAGAVAELVSTRFDDNFTIPLTVTVAASAAQLFLPAL
jgi:dolichol kinase